MNKGSHITGVILLCTLSAAAHLPASASAGPRASKEASQTGLDLLHQGLYGPATQSFLELARAAPDDPQPQLLIAFTTWWRLLLNDDDSVQLHVRFDTAIQRVLELSESRLEADAGDVRALTLSGSAYILRSHVEAQRKKYFRAARSARRGKKQLERALKNDPSQIDALFTLGAYNYYADKVPMIVKGLRFILFMPGGNAERGLDHLRMVASSKGLFRTDARILLAIIEGSDEEHCYGAALEQLRAALDENGGSPLIQALIGKLYMNLGYYRLALAEFENAYAAAAGDDSDRARQRQTLQIAIASALVADWRLAEADAVLKNGALELPAVSPSTVQEIAGIHHQLNVKRGMTADPAPPAEDRRSALSEALILQEEVRFVEALLRLEDHLAQYPDDIVASFVRSRLLFHEGRDREAIEGFRAVRRIEGPRPRWLEGWTELYLGMALSREGDDKKARSHFRRASRIRRFESAERGILELLKLEGEAGDCGL
ncbi:MAG: hypothetical protein V3U83_04050 [Acidobacteriota bacterium]